MAMPEPAVAAVWGKGKLGGLGAQEGVLLVTRPPGNSMTKVAESMLPSKISRDCYQSKSGVFSFLLLLYMEGRTVLLN